jgi:hypothetical protein
MSSTNERLQIDNRLPCVLSVLGLLVVLGAVACVAGLVATSPSLRPHPEDTLETVKLIVCGGLVGWIYLIGLFVALTRILLWIEFGDCITYRCLLGVRSISWAEVVRIGACDWGRKNKLTVRVVRANGDQVSFSTSREQYEQIQSLWNDRRPPGRQRTVPLPWWTSLGIVALGTIVLALAAYVDYLWMTGEWTKSYVSMVRHARGRLFFALLPFLLPVLGALLSGWGVVQFWKRRGKTPKGSEEAQ